jgi:hypothetical protein
LAVTKWWAQRACQAAVVEVAILAETQGQVVVRPPEHEGDAVEVARVENQHCHAGTGQCGQQAAFQRHARRDHHPLQQRDGQVAQTGLGVAHPQAAGFELQLGMAAVEVKGAHGPIPPVQPTTR